MKAIVAVYHNKSEAQWGIGANGTQPLVLSADRKFFRNTTNSATIIVGYTTFCDFPNQQPLPNRRNIILTRKNIQIPEAEVVHDIQELFQKDLTNAFVIGGASIYKQLFPFCDEIYITHVYQDINPDVYFPNISTSPEWSCEEIASGTENAIDFKIEKYIKRNDNI